MHKAVDISFPMFSPSKAPRFNFRFTLLGDGSLRVVTGATDTEEPCTTSTTDLSGTVESTVGWGLQEGTAGFQDLEIDTASV